MLRLVNSELNSLCGGVTTPRWRWTLLFHPKQNNERFSLFSPSASKPVMFLNKPSLAAAGSYRGQKKLLWCDTLLFKLVMILNKWSKIVRTFSGLILPDRSRRWKTDGRHYCDVYCEVPSHPYYLLKVCKDLLSSLRQQSRTAGQTGPCCSAAQCGA